MRQTIKFDSQIIRLYKVVVQNKQYADLLSTCLLQRSTDIVTLIELAVAAAAGDEDAAAAVADAVRMQPGDVICSAAEAC